MPSTEPTALQQFHKFVEQQLESDAGEQLSPEKAVALWREREESVAAVREGLSDVDAGRVQPAEEVLKEFRERLGQP